MADSGYTDAGEELDIVTPDNRTVRARATSSGTNVNTVVIADVTAATYSVTVDATSNPSTATKSAAGSRTQDERYAVLMIAHLPDAVSADTSSWSGSPANLGYQITADLGGQLTDPVRFAQSQPQTKLIAEVASPVGSDVTVYWYVIDMVTGAITGPTGGGVAVAVVAETQKQTVTGAGLNQWGDIEIQNSRNADEHPSPQLYAVVIGGGVNIPGPGTIWQARYIATQGGKQTA